MSRNAVERCLRCSAIVAIVAVGICHVGRTDHSAADDKKGRDDPIVIPRDSVFSSLRQLDAVAVKDGGMGKDALKIYDDVYKRAGGVGPSNVFLVRGNDLAEAMKSTALAFADEASSSNNADEPYGHAG